MLHLQGPQNRKLPSLIQGSNMPTSISSAIAAARRILPYLLSVNDGVKQALLILLMTNREVKETTTLQVYTAGKRRIRDSGPCLSNSQITLLQVCHTLWTPQGVVTSVPCCCSLVASV